MKKLTERISTLFVRPTHWFLSKGLVLPFLLLVPHKAEAFWPLIVGGLAAIGKELLDSAGDAATSLATLALGVGILSYIAFSVAKFLLWIAAMVFNWSMNTMVFGFSTIFGTSDGMLFAWSTLRDIGNIVLLFGFIYIGLQMILNVAHHSTKETLPRLIIAAVLINFSLFAAGAVIDTTNGLATALYGQSSADDVCQGTGGGDQTLEECRLNHGIAGQILGQLNIISVAAGASGMDSDIGKDAATYFSNPVAGTITFVALAILVTVAAIVLFAGALLLLTRGVTLAFLLVASPIGLVCMAIEPLHGIAKKWWETLINNALFAPAFVVLLYIGLRLTDKLRDTVQVEGGLITALTSGDGISAGPVFLFILVIGFMVAALTLSKSFGVFGSEAAIKFATSAGTSSFIPLRGFISRRSEEYGKAYERRVAPALRKLPGGASLETIIGAPISKTFETGKNMPLPGWGTRPEWDKQVKERGDHIRHAEHEAHLAHEFDAAVADEGKMKKFLADNNLKDYKEFLNKDNIGAVAKAMKADGFKKLMESQDVPQALQREAETARKSFFQGKLDTALAENAAGNPDKLVKFMKDTEGYDMKSMSQMSGGAGLQAMVGSMTVESFKKLTDDKEIPEALRKQATNARKESVKSTLNAALADAAVGNYESLEKAMRETSDYDLARTEQAEGGGSGLEEMARHMSTEKFAKFYADESIPTPVRERYRAARFNEFLGSDIPNAAAGDPDAIRRVQNTSSADIIASGALDVAGERTNLLRSVSEKQYEELRRNRSVGPAAREAFEEIRYGTEPGSRFDQASAQATIDSFSSKKDITRVPPETLSEQHVLEAMTPAHFYELAAAGKLNDADKAPIAQYVRDVLANTSVHPEWAAFEAYGSATGPGTKQEKSRFKKLTEYFEVPTP